MRAICQPGMLPTTVGTWGGGAAVLSTPPPTGAREGRTRPGPPCR
jgi:hypothetical protein